MIYKERTWARGSVRRLMIEPDGTKRMDAQDGELFGPFGLIKDGGKQWPWQLIEQSSGLRVHVFRLKCNAKACAGIIAHHWIDGELPAHCSGDLMRDMRATLAQYGHADRRVVESQARELDGAHELSLVASISPSPLASEDDSSLTWSDLEAHLARVGMHGGHGKWLIGGSHSSVQALVSIDPTRRAGTLKDALCGVSHVLGLSVEELEARIRA